MNQHRPGKRVSSLPGGVFREIDPICDAFEQLWRNGQPPQISRFLPESEPQLREILIRELLLIDLEYRTQLGEDPTVFEYLRTFPTEQRPVLDAFRACGLIGENDASEHEHVQRQESPQLDYTEERPVSSDRLSMTVRFRVVEGPHHGREFVFTGHDSFIVGRASLAHFQLPKEDRYFSRAHFMVEVNPPNCRLLDMGSRNGTRVNGSKAGQCDLKNGDRIHAGRTVIEVLIEGEESAPAPSAQVASADADAVPTVTWTGTADKDLRVDHEERRQVNPEEQFCLPPVSGYEVVRCLGKGGMGIVYLARRQGDGMPVAIKMIRPTVSRPQSEVRRFLREASILQQLRHPRIVEFQCMGVANEHLYFVMDLVPGCNGQELVQRDGPIPTKLAVGLACQALEALGYAHKQGIVHRDVKPSNLLIADQEENPICMLADFGLARMYQASRLSGLTLIGEIAGTIPFMPPEQITDFRGSGPSCDQYSLAATLYFLLTGHHIFDFSMIPNEKKMAVILFETPRRIEDYLPDIASDLAKAIHRALEKKPEDRFPDTKALLAALGPFSL